MFPLKSTSAQYCYQIKDFTAKCCSRRESKSANLVESLSSNLRRDRVRYIFSFHYRDHDQSCPFPDSTMATLSGSHVLLDLLVFYTGRLPPLSCCHVVYKYTHSPG